MKPLFIALAALAVAAPAYAQQRQLRLYGNLAGLHYCKLRLAGVPHAQAMRAAIQENMAHYDTEPVFQTPNGRITGGAADMANFITNNCPQMYPSKGGQVEL